jgi:hypothetical protein
VRDAFHQAAVAEENVGVVVDDGVARLVELGGQNTLGECEADGVRNALAKRAGRRFDADGDAVFGVAGRLRVQLAEILQVVDADLFAAPPHRL